MDVNEKLNAVEEQDASILRGGVICEALHATGKYFARCFGPREEVRDEYNMLAKKYQELESLSFFSKLLKGIYFKLMEIKKIMDSMIELKFEDTFDNVVTDVGANQLLDSAFGAGPVAGPFLGLISSVGYTGIPVVADTMSSHASTNHVWVEAGNGTNYPNWSTPASNARCSMSFASASGRAKALSATCNFVIATNAGTVKGCFVVFGTGAVATNNNTSGVLYSAGVFTGGDKVLGIGDTLQVSYTTSV